MARIRTIKPEFFTSEDIVALSPLARLLYIALWCEADKEGRMTWKPTTFKLRYMPGDNCDINALCQEIVGRGLVKLYDDGLAYIPSFSSHQHINPREAASQLPEPQTKPRVSTRQPRVSTSANLDVHAQVGREGKGKEGKEDSAEPQSDSTPTPVEPPVVMMPLNDNSEFAICQSMVDEWSQTYPAVNVVQELREMRTWSNANPAQRKTSRGVNAFVVRWLGKEQDKGGGRGRETASVSSLFAGGR
jgi:hypothetical protein